MFFEEKPTPVECLSSVRRVESFYQSARSLFISHERKSLISLLYITDVVILFSDINLAVNVIRLQS